MVRAKCVLLDSKDIHGFDSLPQRPLSKRAFLGLIGALIFIVAGYATALAMPDKEQNCVAAGGDPWHCAESFGGE